MLAALKSSTSVAGIVAAVGLAAQAVIEMAEAPPRWRLIALAVNAVAVAALGILARDNNKTSEDVGAPNAAKQIAIGDVAIKGADVEAAKTAIQDLVQAALAARKAGGAPQEPPQSLSNGLQPTDERRARRIVVNGAQRDVEADELTFEQVAALAGCPVDTVTYSGGAPGKPQGTVARGQAIRVVDGMVFNAVTTGGA